MVGHDEGLTMDGVPTSVRSQQAPGTPPEQGSSMRLVVAMIKPFKVQEVKDALQELGIDGMSISEVTGAGCQRGQSEIHRGSEYLIKLVPKVKIEVAVPDRMVAAAVDCIVKSAWTGKIGDGKLFVVPLDGVARIRTDERGKVIG